MDLHFITRFEHYLKTQNMGNQNTKTKYVTNFKKMMRIAFANNWATKDLFYHWKAKGKKVDREVLTEAELRTMMEMELPILKEFHPNTQKSSAFLRQISSPVFTSTGRNLPGKNMGLARFLRRFANPY
jgi:hypothetical protein